MSILITGATGRLGIGFKKHFPDALMPSSKELDITNYTALENYFMIHDEIDCVIHAAAATRINDCEKNKEWAWKTNVIGTENIVKICNVYDADLIHISTACAFNGEKGDYDEFDIPTPSSYYGITKVMSEIVVRQYPSALICRTNFVPYSKYEFGKAFTDRFGSYLFSEDVAFALKEIVECYCNGEIKHDLIHICGDTKMSMFDLAKQCPDSQNVSSMTLQDYTGPKLARDMSLITKVWHPYKLGCGL